jgi:hypothetical protein
VDTSVVPDDLNVTRLRVWGRPDGSRPGFVAMNGDFLTAPALGDVFGPSAGITMRVRDGAGMDETFGWTPSECHATASGGLKCKSVASRSVAKFRPYPGLLSLFRFAVSARNLPLQAPFQRPVTVTLTYETTMREGAVAECRAGTLASLLCLTPGRAQF